VGTWIDSASASIARRSDVAFQPRPFPFVLPSRRRTRLIRQLTPITEKLDALEDVRRVPVFRAVVMPPTARFSAYLKERSLHIADFDPVILIETTATIHTNTIGMQGSASRRRATARWRLALVSGRTRDRRAFFYAVDRADAPTVCFVVAFDGVTRLKILPSGSLNHAAFIVPAT
jgi:hypothetical protein